MFYSINRSSGSHQIILCQNLFARFIEYYCLGAGRAYIDTEVTKAIFLDPLVFHPLGNGNTGKL